MYVQIPYIIEGEVVGVNASDAANSASSPSLGSETIKRRPVVTYTCRATLPEGAEIVLANVMDTSMFGGIDDSFQIRRRSSMDAFSVAGSSLGTYEVVPDSTKMSAHIGDRVYIAFINGSPQRPVIIGCIQHPLQTDRFEGVTADTKPQMFMKYLGMSFVIDDLGQMSVTHYGAPEIKYTGGSNLAGALGDAAGSAAGALGALGDSYKGYEEGENTWDETDNDAVKPRDFKIKTTWEFLDDGKFRVRDALGQMFELDPKKSQMLLTNNGVSSTSPADSEASFDDDTSEFLLMDRKEERVCLSARKIMNIYSYDLRADTTEGDHTHDITGDEKITIQGDKIDEIDGSVTRTIKTDLNEEISGNVTWLIKGTQDATIKGAVTWASDDTLDITVKGAVTVAVEDAFDFSIKADATIDCSGNFALTTKGDLSAMDAAGAGMKVSSGKVEVGGGAAGIFDTVSQLIEQTNAIIDAIGQLMVPTSTGPSGTPINAAAFMSIKSQLTPLKAKLDSVKGSL
jgi:hypothetical protein